ncbi:MAG: hypothetical protein Q7S03_03600 [bacterium]|nr:hypothetical protein [bacterium]
MDKPEERRLHFPESRNKLHKRSKDRMAAVGHVVTSELLFPVRTTGPP